MENAKHVFFSVLFALFALIFIACAIFGSTIGHYDWKWIYGIVASVYIICFIFEIGKINGLGRIIRHAEHADQRKMSATERLLHEKQAEKERIEREIRTDKEREKELDHEIQELSEEVDIAALEKAVKLDSE